MKTLKTALIAFASFVVFTNTTSAQALRSSYSIKADEPIEVKYLGVDGNYLLFQVVVNSYEKGHTSFKLTDKWDGELYSDYIRANNKVTTYKIEKKDNQELEFKLLLGNKVFSKSFFVNTARVENTIVAPLITM